MVQLLLIFTSHTIPKKSPFWRLNQHCLFYTCLYSDTLADCGNKGESSVYRSRPKKKRLKKTRKQRFSKNKKKSFEKKKYEDKEKVVRKRRKTKDKEEVVRNKKRTRKLKTKNYHVHIIGQQR